MRVKAAIGPVSAASARAWLATATATVEHLAVTPALGVPSHVVEAFRGYLRQWTDAATGTETFEWEGEVDDVDLREMAVHWVRLVNLAREDPEGTGLRVAPPEAAEFFDALALTFASALEPVEDGEHFAEKFEELVPEFDEGARKPPVPPERIRVLLVDDTPDVRMLVRLGLDLDGRFEVTGEAGDGAEALAACAGDCPDVVVLDVMMPVLDGFEALPRLLEQCPEADVVMFTAHHSRELERKATELGARALVAKDTSIQELADVLYAVSS